MKKLISISLIIFFTIFVTACTKNKESADSTVIKKKKRSHNMKKRAEEYEGGILTGKNGILSGGRTTAQFAADNMLWRASLETLNFIPLSSANYSGGVIVTDWYSRANSKDSIKIQVVFKSDELSTNSIEIISHKKICNTNGCRTATMEQGFNSEIKNKILERARVLNVAKLNKEKK